MKIVNLCLAVFAVVIALGAVALSFSLSFRSVALSRIATGGWNSWAVTELNDAVIVDTGARARGVTVCNRGFRRGDDDAQAVLVRATTGGETSVHMLNHRSCISLAGALVEVVKPPGESFSARGRYRVERGSWRRAASPIRRSNDGEDDRAADGPGDRP